MPFYHSRQHCPNSRAIPQLCYLFLKPLLKAVDLRKLLRVGRSRAIISSRNYRSNIRTINKPEPEGPDLKTILGLTIIEIT